MRIKVTPEMVTTSLLMLAHFDEIEQRMRAANDLIAALQTEDEWAGLSQEVGAQSFATAMHQTLQTLEAHRQIANNIIQTYATHAKLDQEIAADLPHFLALKHQSSKRLLANISSHDTFGFFVR